MSASERSYGKCIRAGKMNYVLFSLLDILCGLSTILNPHIPDIAFSVVLGSGRVTTSEHIFHGTLRKLSDPKSVASCQV